ncbi:hypothetical protein AK812_SmicGene37420 [Symbiodinium microadriaticum]|uniref:Uncharacterized protein n=1 Tax=Symbiodinium microadriaticum TaxID=2951 RepID=A0A1Q9CGC8_SYMMI|nr:hypothetical protein AK812_SmicGene37420 [Symbiodinium microadriaticum]
MRRAFVVHLSLTYRSPIAHLSLIALEIPASRLHPGPSHRGRAPVVHQSSAVVHQSCTGRAPVVHLCFATSEIAALRDILAFCEIPGIKQGNPRVHPGPSHRGRAPGVHQLCTSRAPVLCDKRNRRIREILGFKSDDSRDALRAPRGSAPVQRLAPT